MPLSAAAPRPRPCRQMASWGCVILQEPDLLLDPQLVGEPLGHQVVDDFQRGGQEIGRGSSRPGLLADCGR